MTDAAASTDDCASRVRAADRDRYLATLYAPAEARPAVFALHALDLELARVVANAGEPMIGEIRLAWWREALARLDTAPPPAEPILTAIASHALPRGVTGRRLEPLEDAFNALLLADPLSGRDLDAYAERRGGTLFVALAMVLGGEAQHARAWGHTWALGELVRGPWLERVDFGQLASLDIAADRQRAPTALRPLAGLAALARRDIARWQAERLLEPRGSVARQLVLLRIILNGR